MSGAGANRFVIFRAGADHPPPETSDWGAWDKKALIGS